MAEESKPQKEWRDLAKQAADENDGDRLTRLTHELIEAIDAKLKKPPSTVARPIEDDKVEPAD